MYNWHLATVMHFSQSALLPQSLVFVDLRANLCHACGLPEVSVYLLAGTDEDAEYLGQSMRNKYVPIQWPPCWQKLEVCQSASYFSFQSVLFSFL